MSFLAGLAAGLVALMVVWPIRPRRSRLAALRQPATAASTPRRRSRRRTLNRVVLGVGIAVALVLWPPMAVAALVWWLTVPRLAARRRVRRRHQAAVRSLPDTIDLLALAVGAGQTTRQAVSTLAEAAPPPYAEAFAEVERRAERGEPLVQALGALTSRLGAVVQSVTSVLIAAERHGVAIGSTLDQLSAEGRRQRRLQAEIAARQLPVRLSFPLVCCVLPAFALLTLAPLLAGALSSLRF